jgi:XTP/dITP diphosphohydrolase
VNNEIVVASTNSGKLSEIRSVLASDVFEIRDLSQLSFTEKIEESGDSFEQNARIKAQAVFNRFALPVVADDSGLCVEALDGAPGVMSARFAGPDATDDRNNRLLIEKLKNVPPERRNAWFCCVAVFYYDKDRYFSCEGRVHGIIIDRPRGNGGFGYDPLFYISSFGKTMAQLTAEEKNQISHRGKAFRALKKYIVEYFVARRFDQRM